MSSERLVSSPKQGRFQKVTGLIGGLVGVGLVGLFDWVTGTEISFSIVYLLPVGLTAWYASRLVGVVVSIVATAVWLALDSLGGAVYSHPFIHFCNVAVRLALYLLTAFLVGRLRLLTGNLEILVKERTAALAGEVMRSQQAEQAARESGERFRQLAENIKEVFWMTDTGKNQMIYISPGYEEVWGQTCESLYASPRNWLDAIHADDRDRVLAAALTKQASGQYDEVYRIVRPDGSRRWIHDRAFPVRDESGTVYRIVGIAEDITAQRQADADLRLRSAALEAAADAILITDRTGDIVWGNLAFTQLTGYSVAEVLGQNVRLLKSGKHDQSFYQNLWQTILSGRVWQSEMVNCRKDGGLYPEENTITPVRDPRGEITHFIAVKRDLTERKRAEVQLAMLAQAVESTSEPICITDLNNRFTFVNRAFQQIYGYTQAEVLGQTPEILFSPQNPPRLMAEIVAQTRLGGWRGEVMDRRKDGTEFPIFLSTSQIKDAAGQVIGLMGVAQDITERKKSEKRNAVFSTLGHSLSGVAKPEVAGHIIMEMASELFGWDAGYIHFYSAADDKIIPILTVDTVNGRREPIPETSFTTDPSPLMRQVMSEGAQLINRSGESVPVAGLVAFGDTQRRSASMMYVPIRSGGNPIGVLSIQSYSPQAYAPDDLKLLQAMADHCGDALHRIRAAESLHEAEAKYRSIFENATEGIFQTTQDGRYLNANPALARMFGYPSPAELIASVTNIERQTFVSAESANELKHLLATQDYALGFEAERYRKDGGKFWTSINVRAARDASGDLLYFEGTTQDITERKRADSVLRESEERFRALFESSPLGIAVHGSNGRIVETNAAYERLMGYSAKELRQMGVKRITHPDDVAEGQRLFNEICGGQRDGYQREKRYRRKDGSMIWGQSTVAALRAGAGQLRLLISMVEDVTERKAAVEALRRSERKLRLIAENATDAIFAFDMDRRPLYGNPAIEKLTGYTFAEIQARGFVNWIHPDDQKRMLRHWEELFTGKGYAEVEFRLIPKAGGMKWCSSTWGALLDETGRQIGVQGRERDITDLKRGEAARRELAAIVENSADAIISATTDGRIVSWNQAAERMFGYRAEEVLGRSVTLLATPDHAAEQEKIANELIAGKTVESFDTERRHKDGLLIPVFITASAVRDANGKVTGISAIMQDFTEHKRLEKEVVEISASERRRLGHELHDGLGQYLTGIAFRAKALEQSLASAGVPHAAEANEVVALITNAMAQTRSLARGLDPVGIENIGLVAALQVLAAETEAIFKITCRFQCTDSNLRMTTLRIDRLTALALYRIAQESVHNAITHGATRQITIEVAMDAEHFCLRIKDDGTGFEVENPNQTGMGLRVMRYRASSIGADLRISSQANQGTEISCRVPRTACFPVADRGAQT